MRKLLFILSFILILNSISIIGYKIISANTAIKETKDIIEIQKEKEKYLTPYGYTLDNPNIILNPYGISPLTAIILFETPQDKEITVMIREKDGTTKIQNTFKSNIKHYIPIYGLYPNYNNEVLIKYGDILKKYNIKTEKLPDDLIIENVINNTDNLSFLNINGYLYALDSNNEVRWYLSSKYKYNINKLSNGNFLIPTNNLNNNDYPLGILEIDLLGKVYKKYNIENGYYGSFIEKENSYLILSKNLLELDKQTGQIIKKIELEETYNNLSYNNDTNIINLQNEKDTLAIDLKTNEKTHSITKKMIVPKEIVSPIYTINKYLLLKGISFKTKEITKESNQNIFTIGYKKIDKEYKKYNIKITKEDEFIRVIGDFNEEKVYIILDKFLDKRVYNINYNSNIISTNTLDGKYSIYLKINNTIYKTNKYIKV